MVVDRAVRLQCLSSYKVFADAQKKMFSIGEPEASQNMPNTSPFGRREKKQVAQRNKAPNLCQRLFSNLVVNTSTKINMDIAFNSLDEDLEDTNTSMVWSKTNIEDLTPLFQRLGTEAKACKAIWEDTKGQYCDAIAFREYTIQNLRESLSKQKTVLKSKNAQIQQFQTRIER